MLGLSHLTSAFGILTCIRGLSAFLGPPVGGFVIDLTSPEKVEGEEDTSNYVVAFYISATLLAAASVGHLMAWFVTRASKRRATTGE